MIRRWCRGSSPPDRRCCPPAPPAPDRRQPPRAPPRHAPCRRRRSPRHPPPSRPSSRRSPPGSPAATGSPAAVSASGSGSARPPAPAPPLPASAATASPRWPVCRIQNRTSCFLPENPGIGPLLSSCQNTPGGSGGAGPPGPPRLRFQPFIAAQTRAGLSGMSIWVTSLPRRLQRVDHRVDHRRRRCRWPRPRRSPSPPAGCGCRASRRNDPPRRTAHRRPAASRNPCRRRSATGRSRHRRSSPAAPARCPGRYPPCTWPDTIIGLTILPKSSAAVIRSMVTRPVSGSTSTSQA